MSLEQITEQALALPMDKRSLLAKTLLESFPENEPESGWEQAWNLEIQSRIQEIDDGKITMLDGEQVFEELRLRKR